MRGKPITNSEMLQIWNLYKNQDKSISEICDILKLSDTSVYRVLKVISAQIAGKDITYLFGYSGNNNLKQYARELFPKDRPTCNKCIHRDVCENAFLKLHLHEYGECQHFINIEKISIIEPEYKNPNQLRIARLHECAGCGAKNVDGIVAASMFGASSEGFCTDCIAAGRDSYNNMVNYIASAGRWPTDINHAYQNLVRAQLKLHNKTEAEFTADVNAAIELELQFLRDY